jgi:hypothetical protein
MMLHLMLESQYFLTWLSYPFTNNILFKWQDHICINQSFGLDDDSASHSLYFYEITFFEAYLITNFLGNDDMPAPAELADWHQ